MAIVTRIAKEATGRPEAVAATIARFFFATVGLLTFVVVIGYFPTVRLGGEDAATGLFAGCAVSLVGSWMGSVPVFIALKAGSDAVQAALASMALRFVLVGGMAVAVALADVVSKGPFLVWVAISYVALLVADVMLALRCSSQTLTKVNKGNTEVNDAGIE